MWLRSLNPGSIARGPLSKKPKVAVVVLEDEEAEEEGEEAAEDGEEAEAEADGAEAAAEADGEAIGRSDRDDESLDEHVLRPRRNVYSPETKAKICDMYREGSAASTARTSSSSRSRRRTRWA